MGFGVAPREPAIGRGGAFFSYRYSGP